MSIFTNLCKSQQDRWRHLETRQLLWCPAYHHSHSINPSESDCTWCPPTFQRCRPEFSSVCNLSSTYLFTVGASVVHVAASRIMGHLRSSMRPQQGTRRWPQRGTAVRFVFSPLQDERTSEASRSVWICRQNKVAGCPRSKSNPNFVPGKSW